VRLPQLIAIDALGAAVSALGLWGAVGGGGEVLPLLAQPRVAWSLVAIGTVLMIAVGITIVRAVLARTPPGPGEGE
jgi:hypothetical protein